MIIIIMALVKSPKFSFQTIMIDDPMEVIFYLVFAESDTSGRESDHGGFWSVYSREEFT